MVLYFITTVLSIIVPFMLMRHLGRKLLRKEIKTDEKTYALVRIGIICIVLGIGMYLLPALMLGVFDRWMKFVNGLNLPALIGAILFAIPPLIPLFLSAGLVLAEAIKVNARIKEKEVKRKRAIVFVVLFFAYIIGPILGFSFIWGALFVYLPKSLTSKTWLDFLMYASLILLIFIVYPKLIARRRTYRLEGKLREELLKFCAEQKIYIRDVLVEKNTKKVANAMVAGILPDNRYIILTEGLLENLDKDEIKAVMAHEIGHIKGKHLWIDAYLSIGWFAFWLGVVYLFGRLGIPVLSSPDSFLVVFLGALLTYEYVIAAKIALRNELKADEYAAGIVGREPTARALEKLAELNLIPKKTGKLFNVLTSHPSIEERIKHVKGV